MIQQESQNAEISQVESFGMPISQESAEIEKVNKQAKNPQIFVPQTQDTIEETHNNVPVQTLHKQPPDTLLEHFWDDSDKRRSKKKRRPKRLRQQVCNTILKFIGYGY